MEEEKNATTASDKLIQAIVHDTMPTVIMRTSCIECMGRTISIIFRNLFLVPILRRVGALMIRFVLRAAEIWLELRIGLMVLVGVGLGLTVTPRTFWGAELVDGLVDLWIRNLRERQFQEQ